jgi:hypothetical protein
MMHAVLRSAHDSIHLIGLADAYNLDSLRTHAESMWGDGHLSVFIEISASDLDNLTDQAGSWLHGLKRSGASVKVQTI